MGIIGLSIEGRIGVGTQMMHHDQGRLTSNSCPEISVPQATGQAGNLGKREIIG